MKRSKTRPALVYGTIGFCLALFACAAYYHAQAVRAVEAEDIARSRTIYTVCILITFVILAGLTAYQILPYIRKNGVEIVPSDSEPSEPDHHHPEDQKENTDSSG